MKCIDKKRLIFTVCLLLVLGSLSGCGQEVVLENSYDIFASTEKYGVASAESPEIVSFFAEDLCIAADVDGDTAGNSSESSDDDLNEDGSQTEADSSESAPGATGLFDTKALTVDYSDNIYEKLYPASTTKILTAYVALKHGKLDDIATVSEEALQLEYGSSICEIAVGDKISLEQLLYGLMLCSGNDAANAIAELVSGSNEAFVALMNQEAQALGATNSHFMNAHGLHDEEHYTTLYDLYLIFNAAIQEEFFVSLINTDTYNAEYQNQAGEAVTKVWENSNKYLTGEATAPEGITVIGGKTGTTNAAGNCLVLLSEGTESSPYISIVLKADTRDNLYLQMTELLEKALK